MIYGHPAPCLVTLIDGGPTVMVEPLRFIPVSELPIPSWSHTRDRAPDLNHGAQPGAAARYAAPGEQNTGPRGHQTADTVRGCDGDAASVEKARGGTGGLRAPGSIASTN